MGYGIQDLEVVDLNFMLHKINVSNAHFMVWTMKHPLQSLITEGNTRAFQKFSCIHINHVRGVMGWWNFLRIDLGICVLFVYKYLDFTI